MMRRKREMMRRTKGGLELLRTREGPRVGLVLGLE